MSGNNMKIAIVGMAFRFPGDLSSEEAFWEALLGGRDMVGEIGPERWAVDVLKHPRRSEPGRAITFSAGVLSRLDAFDAAFFGISPREASRMDPQQRLLLELAWEAMENGGVPPSRLAGGDCAVYVGISGLDYGMRGLDDLSGMDAYSMTGNTLSIAANRLSYVFDLRGPSMAVDTACSSSLVALHQACRTLRDGEASTALVGGVNLLLHPYPFVGFTKASMLSAGGRCKSFDAAGDGYVRSEGGAVLLLKPLEAALADGDEIQAVILGSGANSDGGRKSGITIPSVEGQAELMSRVLGQAGVAAADIDYMEAHGTGTAVGDPIETAAIGRVLGQAREAGRPLPIGSVKSNLGHLEPASGMAGLIKTVLALKRRALPPSIHLATPNPRIDFSGLNLEVVTSPRELAKSRRPLRMGVNSFGFGGANAHVLLEEYRETGKRGGKRRGAATPPLFLSARSPEALRELAREHARLLDGEQAPDFADLAHAAAHHRQWLEKRLAVHGDDVGQVKQRLQAYARGETCVGVVAEDVLSEPGPAAFVYSGNGAQWLGMGLRLLDSSPDFAASMAELDGMIRAHVGFSILAELRAGAADSRLEYTEVAQPALFAIQVSLTRLLRAGGLQAAAAAGHSVGEVAAAWCMDILSLEQAVRVICERSAAQALTKGGGRMAAIGLSVERAGEVLLELGLEEQICVAAGNAPNAATLSGDAAALGRLRGVMSARNVFFVPLDLDYAFHSPAMEPIRERLLRRLDGLAPASGGGFYSTVTGGLLDGARLDAAYWWDNVRQPVRFEAAVAAMGEAGCRVFVEIGPHAILQRYIGETLAARGVAGRAIATLKKNDDALVRVKEAVLRAALLGAPLDLAAQIPEPRRRVRLPNYPWQRERHWHEYTGEGQGLIQRARVHPLLGYRLKDAEAIWENPLDPLVLPWLADHKVAGAVVLPGAAYVEMALAASREWFGSGRHELEEMDILAPVVFDPEHARMLRFELNPADGGFRIRSRARLSGDDWSLNAVGRLLGAPLAPRSDARVPDKRGEERGAAWHYALASRMGLEYGPAFQGLEKVWVDGRELVAKLCIPEVLRPGLDQHILHPALLDVCYQSLIALFHADLSAAEGATPLPVRVGRLRHYGGGEPAWFRARLIKQSPRSALADFDLFDAAGNLVARLEGCRFRAAALGRQGEAAPALWKHIHRLQPHPWDEPLASIPASRDLARLAFGALQEMEPVLHRRDHFLDAVPLFDALVAAFAMQAFRELDRRHGDWLRAALDDPGQVAEGVRPLFRWLRDLLREEERLLGGPGDWRIVDDADAPSAEDIWLAILGDHPNALPDLVFVGRVGRHLAGILRGDEEAAAIHASLAASHLLEQYYDASPTYRGMNQAALDILQSLAATWPADRRLRVLEISGGSQDLPRQMLGLLPEDRCDYVIAESGEDQLARLEAEYAGSRVVSVARVDMSQGFALSASARLPERHDVILVHHWLHRAAEIPALLAALRRRLAPGGLLLLLERHPDRAADLQQGLDPAWWHAAADGAPHSSLLPPAAWLSLLRDQGYADLEILREPAAEDMDTGVYAVLARNPDPETDAGELAAHGWLLLCDAQGASRELSERLAARLRGHGQHVTLATPGEDDEQILGFDPASAASVDFLLARAREQLGGCRHVVHLLGLADADQEAIVDGLAIPALRCESALLLSQSLASDAWSGQPPRLWLICAGGSGHAPERGAWRQQPSQAALWGFGRVLMNEQPELSCVLIDLEADTLLGEAAGWLTRELLAPDGESEVILARAGRFAPRMTPREALAEPVQEAAESGFRLDFSVPGQLRNLQWRPLKPRALAEDEVEIRPAAVGLNFRDVMYAMGLLSDEAVENGFSGASLGLELSGQVTRVGARVDEFKVGDEVVAFAPACFSSHVVTRAASVAAKPAAWSHAEAATVPTVFFTVYYALKHLAGLEPGERVLIHGAAGGVGIAAIQVARYLGAEIFATAGSEEKRDFVRMLGADHVMNSRTLAYADEILERTGGEGVDVVLNSLAGEAINRNLRVLRPFGRFLELGKRDFYENTRIGLRPFKDNISYFGIDADQLMVERPALASRLFREVMALFAEGVLRPLPYRVFPANRVVDAFRYMQQARQIGKVVVALDGPEPALAAVRRPRLAPPPRLDKDACYLVSGGLGGFGLESARWLAGLGAGHLILLGRRGMDTPGVESAIAELEALGAQVHARACDIADAAELEAVLAEVRRDLPPLRGVLHAAMVLDDALILNLDPARVRRVLAPKVAGAWNLHRLTRDLPLDFFILYSSATTYIGNPGQANYVAANLYLESLAAMRRAEGLPATSVCWGGIGDVGYLSRNESVKDGLEARLGGKSLTSAQALAQLGAMLSLNQDGLAVLDFDWHAVNRFLPATQAPRFECIRRAAGQAASSLDQLEDIHALIAGRSPDEVREIVAGLLTAEVAQILQISPERIDPARSLYDLGMDSLMGVELVLGIEKRFGIQLPVMALNEGPSIERIAARLAAGLLGEEQPADEDSRLKSLVSGMAAQHAEAVSVEDLDAAVAEVRRQASGGASLIS